MSLIFMDGFDTYNTVSDLLAGSFSTESAAGYVAGRTSPGRAVNLGGSNGYGYITKTGFINTSVRTITLGFAASMSATTGNGPNLQVSFLDQSGSYYFTVTLASNGTIYAGSNAPGALSSGYGTSLGTPVSDNKSGNWHYVELQAVSGPSLSCSFTMRYDGVNVLANRNLSFLGNQGWDGFQITTNGTIANSTAGTGLLTHIDDLYFCDDQGTNVSYNTFLGVCSIQTLFPTSAGTYTEFSPVPTNNQNWQNVSEASEDGDMTYNAASNVGAKDTFKSNSSFTVSQTILAVQPKILVRQDDTATRAMQTYLKSGTTEQGGTAQTLTTTYQYDSDIYINDPHTSTSWTGNGVNNLEFGYNITE